MFLAQTLFTFITRHRRKKIQIKQCAFMRRNFHYASRANHVEPFQNAISSNRNRPISIFWSLTVVFHIYILFLQKCASNTEIEKFTAFNMRNGHLTTLCRGLCVAGRTQSKSVCVSDCVYRAAGVDDRPTSHFN